MNERIRELVEQVGAVRNVMAMGRHDGVLFTEFELEKFAQLIIQECVKSVNCYEALNILDRFGIDSENFGVEE